MSIQKSYPIYKVPNSNIFLFESVGEKGTILKRVIFQPAYRNRYNLAFGDAEGEDTNDNVISNNHDLLKVMSTIVTIVYYFFDKNPAAMLKIEGVDSKRRRLYNSIFKRKYKDLKEDFQIYGITENRKLEEYNPNQFYQIFEIQKKK